MAVRSGIGMLLLSFVALVACGANEAAAQATRTWVSGVGDDLNPCSRTAPCKTFAGAISKTAANGVIEALDPGGFGSVTITKSITLRAVGQTGAITATGTNGINVNGAGVNVILENLRIDGAGTGLNGVNVLQASSVILENCMISGFRSANGTGVRVASGAAVNVTIKGSKILQNSVGVDVAPTSTARNFVLIDDLLLDGNTIGLRATGAAALVDMRRSTALQGIAVTGGAIFRSQSDNIFFSSFTPSLTLGTR